MTKVSMVMQGSTAVVVVDSQTFNVSDDHPNYVQIISALKEREFDGLVDLINMERAIQNFSRGLLTVEGGVVFFDEEPLHESLQSRMLDMLEQGFDVDPLIAFIGNLMQNPSQRAVEELYLFLEGNSLPITTDGHFLAYKNVREDYTDKHSGTFDNTVGSICEMPRNKVNDNRDETCSTGLHFCSLSYLTGFYGSAYDHTMILKINPRDVVSIPKDYNNAKGRCCRYEVVGEHRGEDRYNREAFSAPVQDNLDERAVVQVDRHFDQEVARFDSVEDAADAIGCPASYIRRVVNGGRAATQGYRWFYVDEYEAVTEDEWGDSL